eukprot:10296168-Karenia_brevis.AAC.1
MSTSSAPNYPSSMLPGAFPGLYEIMPQFSFEHALEPHIDARATGHHSPLSPSGPAIAFKASPL